MKYKNIVKAIKEVTKLDVPVCFYSINATLLGTPYFCVEGAKFYNFCKNVINNDSKYNANNWIHIDLPVRIKQDVFIIKTVKEKLSECHIDICFNKLIYETFAILHEFGHAHELINVFQSDIKQYFASESTKEAEINEHIISEFGFVGTEIGLELYKSSKREQYADDFAANNLKAVLYNLS